MTDLTDQVSNKLVDFNFIPWHWFCLVSWKRLIESADIPNEAKKLIHQTIKNSRLLQFEKVEVTRELLDHFIDGLDVGKTCNELIAEFGDPKTTAKLIRLSKTRNRPMLLKFAQVFGGFIALTAVTYLLILAYHQSAQAKVSTDYLPQLNALINDVPEEDRAWPIYRELLTQYQIGDYGKFSTEFMWFEDVDSRVGQRLIKPGDSAWPKAAARLEELTDLLDRIRLACEKRNFGLQSQVDIRKYSEADFRAIFADQPAESIMVSDHFVSTPEVNEVLAGSLFNVWAGGINPLRTLSRLMILDTRWAVEQNDNTRALENIQAILKMASHVSGTNLIGCSVTSIRFSRHSLDLIEEILTKHDGFFTDGQLASIQEHLETIQIYDWLHFEGSKTSMYDLVQRFYSDNGSGDGRITPLGVELANENPFQVIVALGNPASTNRSGSITHEDTWIDYDKLFSRANRAFSPVSSLFMSNRKETIELIDEIHEKADKQKTLPPWSSERISFDDWYDELFATNKHGFLGHFVSMSDAIFRVFDEAVARRDAVVAAIACQRFKLQNDRWPETFEEIVPEFLAAIPSDPLTGGELLMTQEFDMPLIYSVGYDRIDDQGRQAVEDVTDFSDRRVPPHSMFGGRQVNDENSDWILWPQLNWLDRVSEN